MIVVMLSSARVDHRTSGHRSAVLVTLIVRLSDVIGLRWSVADQTSDCLDQKANQGEEQLDIALDWRSFETATWATDAGHRDCSAVTMRSDLCEYEADVGHKTPPECKNDEKNSGY